MEKTMGIIVGVLVVVAIISIILIAVITNPSDINSDKAIPVGGMIKSDDYDYQQNQDSALAKNPIIKIMQMSWSFTCSSDQKRIAQQTPPDNVQQITDIAYIDDGNIYHLLDVYYPQGTTENLPVIIDVHGGGWMYGDKELNKYYCLDLASRGYVVFNINYRLVPDVTVNEQLQDVAQALKWISENMQNYPCDTSNIMLTGDSAGGMLAGYSAVLLESQELRDIFEVEDGNLDLTALWLTSPVAYMKDGAMSVYTKICWGSDYKQKATADYMNFDEIIDYAQLPPTYLLTSSGDTLAHSQTLKMAQLLNEKGVTCQLADYGKMDGESQPHVFSVLDPFSNPGKTANDAALAFFEEAMNNKITN